MEWNFAQILKTVPWTNVTIKVVEIEINHVPEGRNAVREFMEKQGYVFFKLLTIDFLFYRADFKDQLNLRHQRK